MSGAPSARPAIAEPRIRSVPTADGGRILSSEVELEPYERSLGEMLRRWGSEAPERLFLAERDASGGWRELTYGQANAHAEAIAQALIDRGLGPHSPLMILSGNSLDHALLMLGGFLAGVPVVPVSPAYSLMSKDFGKVRHIAGLVRPGLVYAPGEPFAGVLGAVDFGGAETIGAIGDLLATEPTEAVEAAFASVLPESVAKVLFTSGSTDMPKGVINTHRMLCSNQQALAQIWPFTAERPPVLVDWLPWNHTFGGNHNFNLVLKRGGTLYVDEGRPAPALIGKTVANLLEVSPTIYFNVPAGFAQLLPHLERDADLRASFFRRLELIFYAGAALPQDLWERLEAVAVQERGEPVMMTSSWGLTETSPLATAAHFPIDRAGVIGVPVPGVEIKMTPAGDKEELGVRGPNVTPGYLGQPELTASAFDDDGFYRTGDAGRLADPDDPSRGLVFDGRTVEDFKLMTGTFVSVGKVRIAALAAASPLLLDAIVCGHDREYVGLLAWPKLDAVRELVGSAEVPDDELLRLPEVAAALRERIVRYNAEQTGSSTRIGRVMLLAEPPSLDANEITDKGYVNQRAALARRARDVEALFAEPCGPGVIRCDKEEALA